MTIERAEKQVPVAWLDEYGNVFPLAAKQFVGKHWEPLYTTSLAAQRQWIGLTEEERVRLRALGLVGVEIVEDILEERNHG